ncbi:hypothetical protein ACFT2C_27360 [Promicromonospora sp. NPDC057138]|uniref:hypothetical protein n=1 Tax=Promicromonospora sp. NPDC057138 TaxID=3346031 RepID=UPI003632E078
MTETAAHHPPTTQPLRTIAAGAFALAVLAGIAEAVVAVTSIVAQQEFDDAVLTQVMVRGLIFAAALACAWFLAQGRRWAWWALLLGLGVVGLASMVLPMAAALADGASWSTAFEGDVSPAFPVIRALHIMFVLAGVAVMLRPEVRASLAPTRRHALT